MHKIVLMDNDAVLKICCYQLSEETAEVLGADDGQISVLGAARYVLTRAVKKLNLSNTQAAEVALERMISGAVSLEPGEEELLLASEFEEAAMKCGAALDTGESQLLAVLATGSAGILLTGDKRAIIAIERIRPRHPRLEQIRNNVGCLEQLVMRLLGKFGIFKIRSQICAEQSVDKSLSICFSCLSRMQSEVSASEGLKSYISHLRGQAGEVLIDSDDLSSVIP